MRINIDFLGAYCDGQLISWCLTQYDGCIGMAFTKPSARRFGLQSLLVTYLAFELLKYQEHIIDFVVCDNDISLNMMDKMGWKKVCQMDWIGLKIK